MKTKCYSYSGNCPCGNCDKDCCLVGGIADCGGMTDTEKLCKKARDYCEKCAKENNFDLGESEKNV